MTNTRVAVVASALALALLLTGCGGGKSGEASSALERVDVKLENGGFAGSTPPSFRVPADSLIAVNVTTDGDGPYRFSVLAPSTAQTFKLTSNDSLSLTLASLGSGDSAKLIVGRRTVTVTAGG